jgi:hypothetical protein
MLGVGQREGQQFGVLATSSSTVFSIRLFHRVPL